ncbi:adenosylcobinamide amidohydrolase [Alicyclobacillus acidoterrestris]|uniref:adenosylcobinamide amidohydrolase n=1 Tax=Alicyclobacillus suci TaxID=2816080 RepID=UPI0011920CF6|nr:adenosylcobinamide amidohydrolase [Alicyclobacillus suci]GEO26477.1 adenosylcobinamide amidohydrolase [Alicyclobacillus acidoterrestris]
MQNNWTFLAPQPGQMAPNWWEPGRVHIDIESDALHLAAEQPLRVLSSAVLGAGLRDSHHVLNFQVEADYARTDPENDIASRLERRGIHPDDALALMTAVRLADASYVVAKGEGWDILTVVTCGFRNAASVADFLSDGRPDDRQCVRTVGTINIISVVHGWLTDGALVNAVMTATEAKTAALVALGVRTRSANNWATGTTSDAIVIGCDKFAKAHQVTYTGLATPFGQALAQTVYHGVLDSGAKYRARLQLSSVARCVEDVNFRNVTGRS